MYESKRVYESDSRYEDKRGYGGGGNRMIGIRIRDEDVGIGWD